MTPARASAFLTLAWALCACQPSAAPAPEPSRAGPTVPGAPAELALPVGSLAHAPWASATCKPGEKRADLIACVSGVAITRAQVEAVRSAYPPETAVRDIAQALVDEELLAQAAAGKNLWNAKDLRDIQRRTVASVLLHREMEKVQPATMADADIQLAYKNPAIVVRFDHVDSFFTVDGQFLCCTGDFRQCSRREEVVKCIDDAAASAQAVYAALQADKPRSAQEMWAKIRVLTAKYPDLAPAEVQFYYDKAKPHDQQKGYDVVVEPYAAAVLQMQPGDVHAPVRSDFGWHIPYLEKLEPASHRTWKDPEVRAEIARNIVGPVREREAQKLGFALMKQHGVQLFYDKLDPTEAQGADGP